MSAIQSDAWRRINVMASDPELGPVQTPPLPEDGEERQVCYSLTADKPAG